MGGSEGGAGHEQQQQQCQLPPNPQRRPRHSDPVRRRSPHIDLRVVNACRLVCCSSCALVLSVKEDEFCTSTHGVSGPADARWTHRTWRARVESKRSCVADHSPSASESLTHRSTRLRDDAWKRCTRGPEHRARRGNSGTSAAREGRRAAHGREPTETQRERLSARFPMSDFRKSLIGERACRRDASINTQRKQRNTTPSRHARRRTWMISKIFT